MADIKGKTCPQTCDSLEEENLGSKNGKKHTRHDKFVSKETEIFYFSFLPLLKSLILTPLGRQSRMDLCTWCGGGGSLSSAVEGTELS